MKDYNPFVSKGCLNLEAGGGGGGYGTIKINKSQPTWVDIGPVGNSYRTKVHVDTICPSCGAPVDDKKEKCPYCRVRYRINYI